MNENGTTKIIETVRGKDRKRYPANLPLDPAELARLRRLAHNLACQAGLSVRETQRRMLESYGVRRSIGAIQRDLSLFECPACAAEPQDEPTAGPAAAEPVRAVHHGVSGALTGMLSDG